MNTYYIGGDNKVRCPNGTKVVTSAGRPLSHNSAWMIVRAPHITDEKIPEEDLNGVRKLLEERKATREQLN